MKTTLSLVKSILVATSVVAISTITANSASAATFGFKNIFPTTTNSESSGDPFVGDFGFNVIQQSPSQVVFSFFNTYNAASPTKFIGGVYFNQGATGLLSGLTTYSAGNVGTVSFDADRRAANMAQGNKIDFESVFSATKSGAAANGVQGGETLGLLFDGSYDSVVSALRSGDLQVGLHVQGLPGGQSDAFVNQVPEPTTMLGSALALGLFAKMKKRTKKA